MVKHPDRDARPSNTLDYIQTMLGELRILAVAEKHEMLAYLIDMAYLEAGEALGRGPQGSGRKDQRDSTA